VGAEQVTVGTVQLCVSVEVDAAHEQPEGL
jgi:hypothetical protein